MESGPGRLGGLLAGEGELDLGSLAGLDGHCLRNGAEYLMPDRQFVSPGRDLPNEKRPLGATHRNTCQSVQFVRQQRNNLRLIQVQTKPPASLVRRATARGWPRSRAPPPPSPPPLILKEKKIRKL